MMQMHVSPADEREGTITLEVQSVDGVTSHHAYPIAAVIRALASRGLYAKATEQNKKEQ